MLPVDIRPCTKCEKAPILQAVFRLQTVPRMLAMGPSTSPHGQLHVWRAKNGSTSVHPDLGPASCVRCGAEERAGAHLSVLVHEQKRHAVRASCPCQLAITGRGFVLRAHPIEVAGRPRRRGRASKPPRARTIGSAEPSSRWAGAVETVILFARCRVLHPPGHAALARQSAGKKDQSCLASRNGTSQRVPSVREEL